MTKALEAVYYVDSGDLDWNIIAIRPTFKEKMIYWEDTTTHGKTMNVAKQSITEEELSSGAKPKKIEIEDLMGRTVVLRYLTLKLFNEKVKDQVAGKPVFNSTEALQKHYLETNFESYGPYH